MIIDNRTHSYLSFVLKKRRRWMSCRELLALQGFPVYAEVKPGGSRCSFDFVRPATLKPRDAARVIEQSGNSMPVPLINIHTLWAFAFTDAGDAPPR